MLSDVLQKMKERSGLTNQQISEKSRIPKSTVGNVLSGKTPNPSYDTLCAIVHAMNGSMDELEGLIPELEKDYSCSHAELEKKLSDCKDEAQKKLFDYQNEAEKKLADCQNEADKRLADCQNEADKRLTDCQNEADKRLADYQKEMEKKAENDKQQLEFMKRMLEKSEKQNKKLSIWLKILFICLMAMMIFIIVVLMTDITNPDIGYFTLDMFEQAVGFYSLL